MLSKIPAESMHKLIRDYIAGRSMVALGRQYGVTSTTVKYHLLRHHIPIRSRAVCNRMRRLPLDHKALRQLVEEAKLSQREIANRMRVSLPVIERTLRRMRLKSRRGRGSPLEKNCFWKGGRCLDADGYVLVKVPGHPFADKRGYVREHRLAMEKVLGRYLRPEEIVHHQEKGNKAKNDPGNLRVYRNNSEHFLEEHADWPQRDPKTGRFLRTQDMPRRKRPDR
jgi:hypothetical protein